MTYEFGANTLSAKPIIELADGSVVVLRRNTDDVELMQYPNTNNWLQVAAIKENRYCVWSFYILENDYDISIVVENDRGWQAFKDVPLLFQFLAGLMQDASLDEITNALFMFGLEEQLV